MQIFLPVRVIFPKCYAGDVRETVISLVNTELDVCKHVLHFGEKRVIIYFGIATIYSVFK